MQTEDKKNKQLMIYTEINAIMKQSNNLLDIVNANQKEVNKLKAQADKLKEVA
jgi:aminopeptidase-like protein|tara:strand:+ start:36 stop:194 length:159 start_codon:yes stop_codon:yes gene_type:complete